MQEAVIIALLIIFICIFAAGLGVYTVFFSIHKSYFRQQLNIIKKYNKLINGLSGINIYKIRVLSKNDLGNKLDLNRYIDIYKKLKANSVVLKENISVSEAELNAFNLKIAKKYIKTIDRDLNKALADLNELQEAYVNYTQYGSTIETAFQNYLEIYETLANFYEKKLTYFTDFTKINSLFMSIRKTLISIPQYSNKFDYKQTVDTILDLGRKLKTLANAIMLVFRFQIIDTYLLTTKEYNDKLVKKHYDEIATADLQSLQNLVTLFSHTYRHFHHHYRSLELGKARTFAIQAISALNQINQFTYVHINTPTLIDLSIGEIKEQADKILLNRNDIINSMNDLKQYFVLEPKVIESFDLIERDVNLISKLNAEANRVNYKTHTEKIRAIQDLDVIANKIVNKKGEIIVAINKIDDILYKIIKTVTDLSDLSIYFWQLLAVTKKLIPPGDDRNEIQKLITGNIKQLDDYSKQVVSDENPDFDNIAYEISTIVEQSQQIYKQMTTTIVLKAYASKILMYANRYKTMKALKDDFIDANKAFRAKRYSDCIDKSLAIIKTAKKRKE
ncbi:MAG: hypothetical protein KBS35_02495 [Mycoplasma sp.]|nr:hypothetical protein [Candidatus Hennigella equi]